MNRSKAHREISSKELQGAFSFSTGELRVENALTLAPGHTRQADLTAAGWDQCDSQSEWEASGVRWVSIWGRWFSITAHFHNKELTVVDLIWRDGSLLKEDWSATDEDLLKEKKTLAKLISTKAETLAVATSLGVDTFEFDWGVVSVRADPRSQMVTTSIHYLKKAPS